MKHTKQTLGRLGALLLSLALVLSVFAGCSSGGLPLASQESGVSSRGRPPRRRKALRLFPARQSPPLWESAASGESAVLRRP